MPQNSATTHLDRRATWSQGAQAHGPCRLPRPGGAARHAAVLQAAARPRRLRCRLQCSRYLPYSRTSSDAAEAWSVAKRARRNFCHPRVTCITLVGYGAGLGMALDLGRWIGYLRCRCRFLPRLLGAHPRRYAGLFLVNLEWDLPHTRHLVGVSCGDQFHNCVERVRVWFRRVPELGRGLGRAMSFFFTCVLSLAGRHARCRLLLLPGWSAPFHVGFRLLSPEIVLLRILKRGLNLVIRRSVLGYGLGDGLEALLHTM